MNPGKTYRLKRAYKPKIKLFSDQQTAWKYDGEMKQVLSHILKLMYRFDYESDRSKHIGSISGWAVKIIEAIKKDKSSKGPLKVLLQFQSNNGKEQLKRSIGNDFVQNYHFKRRISDEELLDSLTYMGKTLECNNKEEVVAYLNQIFPEE